MFWSLSDVLVLVKKLHCMDAKAVLQMREPAVPRLVYLPLPTILALTSSIQSKQQVLFIVDKIHKLQPNLVELLCQSGRPASVVFRDAKSRLAIGQSNGRSKDMRKVQEEMSKWVDFMWSPPLGDKESCGLHHPQCAILLSDSRTDVNNETAMEQFRAFGLPAMEPSFWERFMYLDGVINPTNRAKGLLRNGSLVKSAKCVLFSPAASHPVNQTGARGRSSHHRGLIGIAKAYNITEINAAFIAYICVVTRHSLTSDEHFSEVCAGFNYVEFYNQVREFLEDPKYHRWSNELLEWWNKEVFAGIRLGGIGSSNLGRQHGTLSMLDAQLEVQELDVGNGDTQDS